MNVNSIEFRTVIYFHHNRRQRGASFGQSESNESAAACVCVFDVCVQYQIANAMIKQWIMYKQNIYIYN